MKTEVLSVPDISCNHCKAAIEGALRKLNGVGAASVDVPVKRVTVDYDERALDHAGIVAAIEEEGYTVEG